MATYLPASVWKGRVDLEDAKLGLRLHQTVAQLDLTKPLDKGYGYALLGFACDLGVRRNQGRVGAALGPSALRSALASLPNTQVPLFDAGDVVAENSEHDQNECEKAQQLLASKVFELLYAGFFPIVVGGGHEVAFGHFCGYAKLGSFPAIVNLDAHFDLRKPAPLPTSGTPFYQIAQLCKSNHKPFRYFCAGIQKQSNTRALFETANNLSAGFSHKFDYQMLTEYHAPNTPIWVSVDLDVMKLPGVSATNPLGFELGQVIDFLAWIRDTYPIVGFEIAELNPAFDLDGITAKSAAWLLWEFTCQPYSLETLNIKLS